MKGAVLLHKDDLVWYASYGSNLCCGRFMCYIEGGTPEGSTKEERGCANPLEPVSDRRIIIPHELYFAGHAERWNGGPAFIALNPAGEISVLEKEAPLPALDQSHTLGRMYLIRADQFVEVVQQENADEIEFDLADLAEAAELGGKRYANLRYGSILRLGLYEDAPIFTFTSPLNMGDESYTAPSDAYMRMLMSGLSEAYQMGPQAQADYFLNKQGVQDNLSYEQLVQLAEGCQC